MPKFKIPAFFKDKPKFQVPTTIDAKIQAIESCLTTLENHYNGKNCNKKIKDSVIKACQTARKSLAEIKNSNEGNKTNCINTVWNQLQISNNTIEKKQTFSGNSTWKKEFSTIGKIANSIKEIHNKTFDTKVRNNFGM